MDRQRSDKDDHSDYNHDDDSNDDHFDNDDDDDDYYSGGAMTMTMTMAMTRMRTTTTMTMMMMMTITTTTMATIATAMTMTMSLALVFTSTLLYRFLEMNFLRWPFPCPSCPSHRLPTGYYGETCTRQNLCTLTSPCNNGECEWTGDQQFTCSCQLGWYGRTCAEYNPCVTKVCSCWNSILCIHCAIGFIVS